LAPCLVWAVHYAAWRESSGEWNSRFRALIGTPIAGALLNAQGGSFSGAVGFSAGSIFIGTALVFVARMFVSKWRIKVKV
jgi:hypothetical protein